MSTLEHTTSSTRIDRRGIYAYVLIAFALTWAVDFYMIARGVRFDNMPTWVYLTVAGTMFFPALAGFIVRRWVTREGFATAGLRLGNWRPYLVILIAVPLVFGLIYGLSWLLGLAQLDPGLTAFRTTAQQLLTARGASAPLPPPGAMAVGILFATLTYGPIITAIATFGEEFGWTGYLLPKLLPLGQWRAAIIYGLVWGLWHAPIIWGGYNFPGYSIAGIFLMCLFTVIVAFTQTSLRLRYGSVLLTTWLHACINTQGRGIWAVLFVGVRPLLGGLLGLVGLVITGLIGIWLLSRSPESLPSGQSSDR